MKKLLAFIMALILVLSLAACGKAKESDGKETEAAGEDEKVEKKLSTDCYLEENEEFGQKTYYLFDYDEDGALCSVSGLSFITADEDEAGYVPSMLMFRQSRYYVGHICNAEDIDFVTLGYDLDEDATNQIAAFKISDLDNDKNLKKLADSMIGLIPWDVTAEDSFDRDVVKTSAEDYGMVAVKDSSDLEFPELYSLDVDPDTCWLCSVGTDGLKMFDSWGVELCKNCYEPAKEYDESISSCYNYDCDNDSDSYYVDLSFGDYYCAECIQYCTSCSACFDIDSTYRREYNDYYCDDCYVEGLLACGSCSVLKEKLNRVGDTYSIAYLCDDCAKDAVLCVYCGSEDTSLHDGFYSYVCDDCFEERNDCRSCDDPEKETSYRDDYRDFYCDDCYVEGMSVCDRCGTFADELLHVDGYDIDVCEECYEEETLCRSCYEPEKETSFYDEEDVYGYYCDECYLTRNACEWCNDPSKEAVYTNEYIYGNYCEDCYLERITCYGYNYGECTSTETEYYEDLEDFYCDECYEKMLVCHYCKDSSKETVIYEGIYAYLCEDCFAERSVCENCHDSSKETECHLVDSNADGKPGYSMHMYLCDDCYGDGSKLFCGYCCHLFDELIIFETEYGYDEFLCEDCYAEANN